MTIQEDLQKFANKKRAAFVAGYFKTKKGEYGEGDVFLGLSVPQTRSIAAKYTSLPLAHVQKLLESKVHEIRLAALMILVKKYQKAPLSARKEIFDFYVKNTKYINNWDLVDLSSREIIGEYLWETNTTPRLLESLATSKNLWERRIAIIATYAYIKKNIFIHTLRISEMLLTDSHDLIHKAVGWMLREVGNRNQKVEEEFLQKHYKSMPRTMLRYAIEKFSRDKRAYFMAKSM